MSAEALTSAIDQKRSWGPDQGPRAGTLSAVSLFLTAANRVIARVSIRACLDSSRFIRPQNIGACTCTCWTKIAAHACETRGFARSAKWLSKRREMAVQPPTLERRGRVVDLMAALKQSLEEAASQRRELGSLRECREPQSGSCATQPVTVPTGRRSKTNTVL